MATALKPGGHVEGLGKTHRTDAWWLGPAITFVVFSSFLIYGTWAAFQNQHYWVGGENPAAFGGYLSPFYSPPLFADPVIQAEEGMGRVPMTHVWLGEWPSFLKGWDQGGIWPSFMPLSPGFLILIFPGAIRFTCYYYRKAYYRSFGLSPPGCGVSGPKRPWKYGGETTLFLFQNLHRYALYAAICFIFILGYDAFLAFFRDGQLGFGVGTLMLTVNVVLLGCYTFGCHSWRHIIAGRLDCFSCDAVSKVRHGAWKKVTWLNERHMLFAWLSLFWVGFSDVYVRLVSSGVITDLNTWGS